MGNSSSDEPRPALHVRHFPMWVIATSEVLQMTGPPEVHEDLLKSGRLFQHQLHFYSIFVSHKWRSRHHGLLPKEADLVTQFGTEDFSK